MKIRIANSTGKGRDTEITDAETGEKVGCIYAAEIRCYTTEFVRAELTFNIPQIDVIAIATLSEKTKYELQNLRDLLERIDGMEGAQKEVA